MNKKRYSIDDLGKFDGSKMTIKVNGKQIYPQKRYAIVRADINCPKDVCGEEDFCFLSKGKTLSDMCDYCEFLQEKRIIGDTKEQLIRKVAQVIKIRLQGDCVAGLKDTVFVQEWCLVETLAKEIVEFLGVE